MRNALIIDPDDNVVVAIYPLKAHTEVTYALPDGTEACLTTLEDIPCFHKIARKDISCKEPVIKYGEFIGQATQDIKSGEHVHIHNCISSDALKDAEGASI